MEFDFKGLIASGWFLIALLTLLLKYYIDMICYYMEKDIIYNVYNLFMFWLLYMVLTNNNQKEMIRCYSEKNGQRFIIL